jgi:hypothetical protein
MRAEAILISSLTGSLRTPRLRTLEEFAEQEIVLPSGPYAGRRFRGDRHPAGRLWLRELDSGRWQRAFLTGPNQDGKSLLGFVIPTMYLLFERQETVILGVPSLDLVKDKWSIDLRPTIQASQYAEQLPTSGGGSRDGESVLFEFRNGARLRFMTAGGDDQSRAGFTSPNLVVTETDGFDKVGGNSREGDKFSQLVRRTLAFGDRAGWSRNARSALRPAAPGRNTARHAQPDRPALPPLQSVGHTRAGALPRLAGRGHGAGGGRQVACLLPELRSRLEQRAARRSQPSCRGRSQGAGRFA